MARSRRHVPTLKRTPAQKRALVKIRRLKPLDQIHALLEPGVVSYLREGPGHVYFTAQLPSNTVREQRLDRLPDQFIVKWGESSCLPRRQLQYDRCAVDRTHMWFMAFQVERRLLAGEFPSPYLRASADFSFRTGYSFDTRPRRLSARSVLPALLVRAPAPRIQLYAARGLS
ncbi:hypothetical protein B0H12DRAFT_1238691 [Mycena haematopus]|nr:hypothetical protein B0H12DRAFT_1238691 [Mycena haematopus]